MFVTDDRILETELHVFLILKGLSAKVGSVVLINVTFDSV